MHKARYQGSSVGMSAIEQACWDILGKSLGVPVWQLWGGKHRDTLRVYANGWYKGPRTPEFFAEAAAELVERGYTAMKFDPFGGAYQQITKESERLAVEIVRAVREAVGPDVDILIEAHDRFTVGTAIRLGRKLEAFEPMWLETPVRTYDLAGHLEVARSLKIPVVLGEGFTELRQFADLLSARVIDIVQPEPQRLGPSQAWKACAIAQAYTALVACHQAQSPFCTAMCTHLHASIPNFLIQENFDDSLEPWTWEVLTGVPRVQNGYLTIPETPGWGVELNEAEALKYPYGEKNFLRLFEEGWETRKPPEG
jgi:galactonate dehydratase